MKVTKDNSSIILEDFDIKSTLECGQIFSFFKSKENNYIVTSGNKYANIITEGNITTIYTDDVDYFYNFFDLDTDYEIIKTSLCDIYPDFNKFLSCGNNIRILRQDRIQTILSFIVSANNNIKRIKNILFKLSARYGHKIADDVYSFPTLDELKDVTSADYFSLGMGYRAPYMADTVSALRTEEYDIDKLSLLPTIELKCKLLSLKGVGPKVADCILFFGFGRTDVFPVDTWIRKSYSLFSSEKRNDKQITEYFVNLFKDFSGYAQQYIFNYMINS